MAEKKDYYNILGVDKSASKDEIKKAYKRLAKRYHPDINKSDPGASDKFKEINEAAAVLADDQKRAQYDQFGSSEGFQGFDFSGFDFADFSQDTSFDFGDIFDRFFSRGFDFDDEREDSGRGGNHLRIDLEITLEDASTGVSKQVNIPRLERCGECNGTGALSSTDIDRCSACRGAGMIRQARRTAFGIFSTTGVCSTCGGSGEVIRNPCRNCRGTGRIEKKSRLDIKIPAGVDDGTRLRVKGEGEAAARGSGVGDLFVVVRVKHHKIFERNGPDISVDVPITFGQAALGDDVEVPTLKGKATLKIPPGTQSGTVFRMRGKGIPSIHGYGTGSENVRVIVQVPEKLTRRQRELLEEFDKEGGRKGFFF
jgi:molecular chaperone DnaJ